MKRIVLGVGVVATLLLLWGVGFAQAVPLKCNGTCPFPQSVCIALFWC